MLIISSSIRFIMILFLSCSRYIFFFLSLKACFLMSQRLSSKVTLLTFKQKDESSILCKIDLVILVVSFGKTLYGNFQEMWLPTFNSDRHFKQKSNKFVNERCGGRRAADQTKNQFCIFIVNLKPKPFREINPK